MIWKITSLKTRIQIDTIQVPWNLSLTLHYLEQNITTHMILKDHLTLPQEHSTQRMISKHKSKIQLKS
jgi:hypothetical protein